MSLLRVICIMLFAAVAAKNAAVDASFNSDDLFKRPNVDGLEDLDHWLDTYHPHGFDTQGIDTEAQVESDESDIELVKAGMRYLDHPNQLAADRPASSSHFVNEYPSADHDIAWPKQLPPYTVAQPGFTSFAPSFKKYKLAKHVAVAPPIPAVIPVQYTPQPYPNFATQNPNVPSMHYGFGNGYLHPYSASQSDNPSHQSAIPQQTTRSPSMPPMHQGFDSGYPHLYSTSQSAYSPHQGAIPQQTTRSPSMPPMHQGLDSDHHHLYSTSQSGYLPHQAAVLQQAAHPNAALQRLPIHQGSTPVPTSNSQPVEPAQTRQPIVAMSRRRKPPAALPGNSSQALKGISKTSSIPPKKNKRSILNERLSKINSVFLEQQKPAILAFGKQQIACEHCSEIMELDKAPNHYWTRHPGMACQKMTHCDDYGERFRYTAAAHHQVNNSHWYKFNLPDITTHGDPTRIRGKKALPTNAKVMERRYKINNEFSEQQKQNILAFGGQPIKCEHCNEDMTLIQAQAHYRTRHPSMGCKKIAHCDDCGADFAYTAAREHHITHQHWDKFYPFSVPALGK